MNLKRLAGSEAFVKGVSEGLAAPFFFFAPLQFTRASKIDASVEAAWHSVGKSISKSYQTEINRGKNSCKKAQRERTAA